VESVTKEPSLANRVLKIAAWVLVAIALATVAWIMVSRPVPVRTAAPRHGLLVVEVFGTGTLESKVVVGVSSKIVGKVVEVLVDQGDVVTHGQTLARLEAKDFEDAVRVAAAQRDQAAAELAKARADLERERSLLAGDLVSKTEFEVYDTGGRVAEAKLRNAEAALGVAQARLADTRIVSPASGRVITRDLEVGATVVPGAPIFRVAGTPIPWVVAQVDERASGALRVGQPARVVFETNPGAPHVGRVARLGAETDRVTEEREVDVTLEHLPPNGFLGQRADVYVETARKPNALQIPLGALTMREGERGVLVVVGGRARWRPVQLGLQGREAAEVVHGLGEGDRVVLNPQAGKQPIAPGARVAATSMKEAP